MLAPALRRYVDRRPFENFQQRLLHPFARYVARDRRVVALAGDLVDLVDEDDAPFGGSHVVGGHLQQPREDALHVFAHVAGFGEHRGVDDGEGDVQQPCDRACHERLARSRRADEHDVRFVDLDLAFGVGRFRENAFVVIVDRYRQVAFGRLLTDDVLVEHLLDLRGFEQFFVVQRRLLHRGRRGEGIGYHVVLDERMVALFDAFVADAGAAAALKKHQHLAVVFTAKGAVLLGRVRISVLRVLRMCHSLSFRMGICRVRAVFGARRVTCVFSALRRSGRSSWLRRPSSSSRGRRPFRSS